MTEDDGCPVCGKPIENRRMLTEGKHDHDTNLMQKEADSYCIEYDTESKHSGVRVFAKIYTHLEDGEEE